MSLNPEEMGEVEPRLHGNTDAAVDLWVLATVAFLTLWFSQVPSVFEVELGPARSLPSSFWFNWHPSLLVLVFAVLFGLLGRARFFELRPFLPRPLRVCGALGLILLTILLTRHVVDLKDLGEVFRLRSRKYEERIALLQGQKSDLSHRLTTLREEAGRRKISLDNVKVLYEKRLEAVRSRLREVEESRKISERNILDQLAEQKSAGKTAKAALEVAKYEDSADPPLPDEPSNTFEPQSTWEDLVELGPGSEEDDVLAELPPNIPTSEDEEFLDTFGSTTLSLLMLAQPELIPVLVKFAKVLRGELHYRDMMVAGDLIKGSLPKGRFDLKGFQGKIQKARRTGLKGPKAFLDSMGKFIATLEEHGKISAEDAKEAKATLTKQQEVLEYGGAYEPELERLWMYLGADTLVVLKKEFLQAPHTVDGYTKAINNFARVASEQSISERTMRQCIKHFALEVVKLRRSNLRGSEYKKVLEAIGRSKIAPGESKE